MLNETTEPTTPRIAPARQLDVISRLRSESTAMLGARMRVKAILEEVEQTGMLSEFDREVWTGDNPALGVHASMSLAHIAEAIGSFRAMEKMLVDDGHIAGLLRIKE